MKNSWLPSKLIFFSIRFLRNTMLGTNRQYKLSRQTRLYCTISNCCLLLKTFFLIKRGKIEYFGGKCDCTYYRQKHNIDNQICNLLILMVFVNKSAVCIDKLTDFIFIHLEPLNLVALDLRPLRDFLFVQTNKGLQMPSFYAELCYKSMLL